MSPRTRSPSWNLAPGMGSVLGCEHTDLAKAQDAGLPDLIASGNQSVGILVELLIEIFGSTWFTQGILDLKIVNSVYSGDTVQAKAVVMAKNLIRVCGGRLISPGEFGHRHRDFLVRARSRPCGCGMMPRATHGMLME